MHDGNSGDTPGAGGGGTLLLVDDEPQICSTLKRLFDRDGHRVHTANSADEAMAVLAEHAVDLIISDQRMPRKSGLEFLAEAAARYPTTVRFLLSGAADPREIERALTAGVIHEVLEKPIDMSTLRAHTRLALARAEALRNAD